jgi:hypothetical protein
MELIMKSYVKYKGEKLFPALGICDEPIQLWLIQTEYPDGNFAIEMRTREGELYGNFYANLTATLTPKDAYCAAINVKDYPNAMDFIARNHLGEQIGEETVDYVTYPVVKFNREVLDAVAVHDYDA